MQEKREFTGVFVPAHIWVSRELSPAEKMILAEIEALSKRNGWCDASRAHFAEWLGIDETNVSKCFTKLEKLGFLQQQQNPGFRTRRRVVNDRFYTDSGVYNLHGGGVKTTRGGVLILHPKYKKKYKLKEKKKYKAPLTRQVPFFQSKFLNPRKLKS